MPNLYEIVLNNILHKEETNMVYSQYYYPKRHGSQFIIDRLAEKLPVETNCPVRELTYTEGHWIINNQYTFDAVVYTVDVRQLNDIISNSSIQSDLPAELVDLRSNGTSNVLCYTDPTDLSWLYIPDENIKAHRIIYTGNFSPANNANKEKMTCVVEFSGKFSEEIMYGEIKKLPGNLKPIQPNYQANSYVIQDDNTRKLISAAKQALQPYRMYLCGRFAEWEYYNMDKAIEAAMKVTEEIGWPTPSRPSPV
jgi:protoporphyrinogen oxidase